LKKKRFLILRFSSIGDIVLTTPVLRCLRKTYPEAEIHFATKAQFRGLLTSNPYVDKVFVLEKNLRPLLLQLSGYEYDAVFDLHHNLRTFLIKFFLKIRHLGGGKWLSLCSFDKLNWQKWLLVRFHKNYLPEVHIVQRYLATTQGWGVQDDGQGLDFFIPEKDKISTSFFPETHQNGFTAYAIGGQHTTKKLPLDQMERLCAQISGPIVLLGGPEDAQIGEWLAARNARIFNACGRCNLNQSASILSQSTLVYTHDTGLMHIAAALQKPVVSLWGNTVPAFGMYPYRTSHWIWENTDLTCRPCSKIGFDACPKGHFRCLNDLDMSQLPPTQRPSRWK
jgi:ADP-heptose:LPS heptosyltransferase